MLYAPKRSETFLTHDIWIWSEKPEVFYLIYNMYFATSYCQIKPL